MEASKIGQIDAGNSHNLRYSSPDDRIGLVVISLELLEQAQYVDLHSVIRITFFGGSIREIGLVSSQSRFHDVVGLDLDTGGRAGGRRARMPRR